MSLTDIDLPMSMTPYTFTGKVQPFNLAIDPVTRFDKEDLDDHKKLQASTVESPFYGPNMDPTWYDVLHSYFCSPPRDLFPQPTEEDMARYGWYRVAKPRFPLRAKEVMLPEEEFAAKMVEERVNMLCKQMEREREQASMAADSSSKQPFQHESAEEKPTDDLDSAETEESTDLCTNAAPPKLQHKTTESTITGHSSGYFSAGTSNKESLQCSQYESVKKAISPLSNDHMPTLGLSCVDINQQVNTVTSSSSAGHKEQSTSCTLPPPEAPVLQRKSWASRVKQAVVRFLSTCYMSTCYCCCPQPNRNV